MVSATFSAGIRRVALIGAAAAALAACTASDIPKQLKPVPYELVAKMKQLGARETSKLFIRIFKESSELEVWKETDRGDYTLLHTYHVCKWSGELGPKLKEGDRQAPEGFYTVRPAQMNPNSKYYLSFNIGYPNTFDKAHERTGSHLMVHGACSSAGCYSMTDEAAGEIFAMARDAFRGGQRAFQIMALPFRMTPENLARHRGNPNMDFWRMLKEGNDHFELTKRPPKVDVCGKRYVYNADAGGAEFKPTEACPSYTVPESLAQAVAAKQANDNQALSLAIAAADLKRQEAANEAQIAAANEAAKAQRAAERAARPSLMSRIFNRSRSGQQGPSTPISTPTPIGQTQTGATDPTTLAAVPMPRMRRSAPPAAASTPLMTPVIAEAPPAPAAQPPAETAAADQTGQSGRVVKRKFFWWDDG